MSNSTDKTRVQAQLNQNLVTQANQIMYHLGLSPTTLIKLTYQQLVHDQALPFQPHYDDTHHHLHVDVTNEWYHRSENSFADFKNRFAFLVDFAKPTASLMQRAHLITPFNIKRFELDLMPSWQTHFEAGYFVNKISIDNHDLNHQNQNLTQLSKNMMHYLTQHHYTDVVVLQTDQLDQKNNTGWLIYVLAETPINQTIIDQLVQISLQ